MNHQVVVQTRVDTLFSKVESFTEEEVEATINGIKEFMLGSLDYIELETERGWIIVPGNQIIWVELRKKY